eukprot:16452060-Heterocapsa_arctica.AAC.1
MGKVAPGVKRRAPQRALRACTRARGKVPGAEKAVRKQDALRARDPGPRRGSRSQWIPRCGGRTFHYAPRWRHSVLI